MLTQGPGIGLPAQPTYPGSAPGSMYAGAAAPGVYPPGQMPGYGMPM